MEGLVCARRDFRRAGGHPDPGPEGGAATLLNNSVVHDAGASTGRQVDHLGPDILVLALAREGDADELRGSSGTDQVRPRNLPGAPRAQVHVNPF